MTHHAMPLALGQRGILDGGRRRLLAELIVDRTPSPEFRLTRFAEGAIRKPRAVV